MLHRQLSQLVAIVIGGWIYLAASPSQAGTVTFTFTNDITFGNVAGTVQGTVSGLQFNGLNQAASTITIDLAPPGLFVNDGFSFGNDAKLWNVQNINTSFDLIGGVVQAASVFAAQDNSTGGGNRDLFCLNTTVFQCGWTNLLTLDNGSTNLGNQGAFGTAGGVTFTTFVPIPAAAWLFASGLGLLGWMRRRQIA